MVWRFFFFSNSLPRVLPWNYTLDRRGAAIFRWGRCAIGWGWRSTEGGGVLLEGTGFYWRVSALLTALLRGTVLTQGGWCSNQGGCFY
jgi:hypothetical protein